jgi:ABC-type enterochelin transport system ATPase subunit
MSPMPATRDTKNEVISMLHEMNRFVQAHDRYVALNDARSQCTTPAQREFMHIKILEAYLEVQFRARHIAAMQYADGNDYADQN